MPFYSIHDVVPSEIVFNSLASLLAEGSGLIGVGQQPPDRCGQCVNVVRRTQSTGIAEDLWNTADV